MKTTGHVSSHENAGRQNSEMKINNALWHEMTDLRFTVHSTQSVNPYTFAKV